MNLWAVYNWRNPFYIFRIRFSRRYCFCFAPFGIIRMTCKNSYRASTTDQSNLTSFIAHCVTVSGAGLELMASIKNEEEDDDKGNQIPIAIVCVMCSIVVYLSTTIYNIYNVCMYMYSICFCSVSLCLFICTWWTSTSICLVNIGYTQARKPLSTSVPRW